MQIRGNNGVPSTTHSRLLAGLGLALSESAPVEPSLASRVFATESVSNEESHAIVRQADSLQATIAAVTSRLEMRDSKMVMVQEHAAVQGAMAASNSAAFLSRDLSMPASTKDMMVMPANDAPSYLGHRSKVFATEAFDNSRADRSAVLYTTAYNYSMSRQEEFGETVWPTLTLPADQVGFGVVVDRLTIHRGVQHSTTGAIVDFKKVDLMRAMRNPKLLQKDRTLCVPVVRGNNLTRFVDAAVIPAYDRIIDGQAVHTAPLKFGVESGLRGLCQTDAELAGGIANQTDTLDPTIIVEHVYVQIGDDILKFNTGVHASFNFTYAPQGQDKARILNASTKSLRIKPDTTDFAGAALVSLGALATSGYTAIVEMDVSGSANIETTNIVCYGNKLKLVKVLDSTGEEVPSSNANYVAIAAAFNDADTKMLGFDAKAYKSNVNMRERGDFIDRTRFTMLYEVPLLSPVTAQRPVNSDASTDGGDYEALVQHTRFRQNNEAVTAIFASCDVLSAQCPMLGENDDPSPDLGPARYHVKPTFIHDRAVDMATLVDSLSSSTRTADLRSALVNRIREIALQMYISSEYQAAALALGLQGKPVLNIATDVKTHTYLMIEGDLRTLSEKFDYRIVSTIDERMEGKIFLSFGVYDESRNQAPHLLNFGNCVWAPEVVLAATVSGGESVRKETMVQPRWRFVMISPVAALLEITNLPGVFNKIPVHFTNVP